MDIPQGLNVRIEGHKITVKGPAGEVHRNFPKGVQVKADGAKVEVVAADKAIKGTLEALISGMFLGASKGYSRSLKLLYAHFPITVEVKGSDITIKNFLGEKQPRKTVLVGATKVQAKGQMVTISGPDKEAVGQTIANMRIAMKIKDKDGRVFQDGLYDTEGEA
ncbi:MAG TPA: 50S ribosomal protein L6 [Candidatus Bilamarchaeum sp.]|nr:50S ribosomal protein L6 [Candidatus Bilamarchaeum sp.]